MRARSGNAFFVVLVGALLTGLLVVAAPASAELPACVGLGIGASEPTLHVSLSPEDPTTSRELPKALAWERTYYAAVEASLRVKLMSATVVTGDASRAPAYPSSTTTYDSAGNFSLPIRAARGEPSLRVAVTYTRTDGIPSGGCAGQWVSEPLPARAGRGPSLAYVGTVEYDEYNDWYRDRAARFEIRNIGECTDQASFTIGPISIRSGSNCVFRRRTVRLGRWEARVRPTDGYAVALVSFRGKHRARRTVDWRLTYGDRVVRKGQRTFFRKLRPGGGGKQIFADTNIDSYLNYCINEGKPTYSQDGGRVYCYTDSWPDRWYTVIR